LDTEIVKIQQKQQKMEAITQTLMDSFLDKAIKIKVKYYNKNEFPICTRKAVLTCLD